MDGEDIKRIVEPQPDLHQLDGAVADQGGEGAEHQRRAGRDEAGGRCHRGEAGDCAGREANGGRLAESHALDRDPHQRGRHRRGVGVDDRGRGVVGRGQCRAAVEAEPADPQQHRADHRQAWSVRQQRAGREALPAAEEQGDDQRRQASGGVDHDAACKVERAELRQPAAAPYPMRHGCVDDQAPQAGEDDHPREPRPIDPRTDHQGGGDRGESHLEQREGAFRQSGVRAHVVKVRRNQHESPAATDHAVGHVAECHGIAGDDPHQ